MVDNTGRMVDNLGRRTSDNSRDIRGVLKRDCAVHTCYCF